MIATERVVNDLNVSKLMLCNLQVPTPEMCVKIGQAISSAIALLNEQDALLKEQEAEIREKNQRIWELLCERDSDDGR